MIPAHLKYAPTHEWFSFDNKAITIGLTKFIIDELDELLFLDLPKVGDEILSGISFGELEALNRLIDITSPMAGEIIAVNERLYENLNILSKDPFSHGWLIKFVTKEIQLLSELLSATEYETYIDKLRPAAPIRRRRRHAKIKIRKGKRQK